MPYEQIRGPSFLACHFGGESSVTQRFAEAVQNFHVARRGKAPNATSRVCSSRISMTDQSTAEVPTPQRRVCAALETFGA